MLLIYVALKAEHCHEITYPRGTLVWQGPNRGRVCSVTRKRTRRRQSTEVVCHTKYIRSVLIYVPSKEGKREKEQTDGSERMKREITNGSTTDLHVSRHSRKHSKTGNM